MDRRALLLLPVLAACSKPDAPDKAPQRDPAVVQALNDPLMIDPDLSQRNEGAAALTVTTDMGLPVLPVTAEAAAGARAEAARMVGGLDKLRAPPAAEKAVADLPESWSPGHHLAAIGADEPCLKRLKSSAIFAARLPEALPVYPRGGTLAAAGSDTATCTARAVRFATPVSPGDVLAFYWAQARAARLSPRAYTAEGAAVLRGSGKGLAFDVRVRAVGEQTLVELATLSR